MTRALLRAFFRPKAPAKPVRQVHFLHIGKNAGTQIKELLTTIEQDSKLQFIIHPHHVSLREVPGGTNYFFSIRDPISRYSSGFYSRKRKGKPRYSNEWSPHDALAFGDFEHANDLAEALFAEGALGDKAFKAMKSIQHTAMNQADWFVRVGHFLELRPPLWIIRQEHFERDFDELKRRLGITRETPVFTDAKVAHKNDYSDIPPLSDKAVANLRTWYSQDYAFYKCCENWMAQNHPTS